MELFNEKSRIETVMRSSRSLERGRQEENEAVHTRGAVGCSDLVKFLYATLLSLGNMGILGIF